MHGMETMTTKNTRRFVRHSHEIWNSVFGTNRSKLGLNSHCELAYVELAPCVCVCANEINNFPRFIVLTFGIYAFHNKQQHSTIHSWSSHRIRPADLRRCLFVCDSCDSFESFHYFRLFCKRKSRFYAVSANLSSLWTTRGRDGRDQMCERTTKRRIELTLCTRKISDGRRVSPSHLIYDVRYNRQSTCDRGRRKKRNEHTPRETSNEIDVDDSRLRITYRIHFRISFLIGSGEISGSENIHSFSSSRCSTLRLACVCVADDCVQWNFLNKILLMVIAVWLWLLMQHILRLSCDQHELDILFSLRINCLQDWSDVVLGYCDSNITEQMCFLSPMYRLAFLHEKRGIIKRPTYVVCEECSLHSKRRERNGGGEQ